MDIDKEKKEWLAERKQALSSLLVGKEEIDHRGASSSERRTGEQRREKEEWRYENYVPP
jgi:hypothetical protein